MSLPRLRAEALQRAGTPFGLAMTPFGVKILNAFVLEI
jgi:hypothetical protein